MNKQRLLDRLNNINIMAGCEEEPRTTAQEVILALVEYINNPEIEDAVNEIPF